MPELVSFINPEPMNLPLLSKSFHDHSVSDCLQSWEMSVCCLSKSGSKMMKAKQGSGNGVKKQSNQLIACDHCCRAIACRRC